jgi:hypothetical protein
MRKTQGIYILFALSLVGILGLSYIVERSPVLGCPKWGFITTKGSKYYTNSEKVVIQPWRGQHHSYAIFSIPEGYRNDKLFKLTLPGNNTYCGYLDYAGKTISGDINAKPGYYLFKGYLNTRIVLGLIANGKINELQQPINWRAGYVKKAEK